MRNRKLTAEEKAAARREERNCQTTRIYQEAIFEAGAADFAARQREETRQEEEGECPHCSRQAEGGYHCPVCRRETCPYHAGSWC